jgi:hypothetical protein
MSLFTLRPWRRRGELDGRVRAREEGSRAPVQGVRGTGPGEQPQQKPVDDSGLSRMKILRICPLTNGRTMMKRRSVEDYRDLGALLKVADEALVVASVLADSMYPKKSGDMRRIVEIQDVLRRYRFELDGRWRQELTEPLPEGDADPYSSFVFPLTSGAKDRPAYHKASQAINELRGGRDERRRAATRGAA